MLGNDSGLDAAFKAKDARFDGRFFVGISSTGIYCCPVVGQGSPSPKTALFIIRLRKQSKRDTALACCVGRSLLPALQSLTLPPIWFIGRRGCWKQTAAAAHIWTSLPHGWVVLPGTYGARLQRNIMCRRSSISKHADCSLLKTCSQTRICRFWMLQWPPVLAVCAALTIFSKAI